MAINGTPFSLGLHLTHLFHASQGFCPYTPCQLGSLCLIPMVWITICCCQTHWCCTLSTIIFMVSAQVLSWALLFSLFSLLDIIIPYLTQGIFLSIWFYLLQILQYIKLISALQWKLFDILELLRCKLMGSNTQIWVIDWPYRGEGTH